MQMRPRNYGKLNRSIARATSYAIREANRGYSKNQKYTQNYNKEDNSGCMIMIAIGMFILICLALGSCGA